ncbi:unnamed protein product [Ascophyllum nodosum]
MNFNQVALGITVLMAEVSALASAFSIPAGPVPPCNMRQNEWNDYKAAHAGNWQGMWTTYNAAGNQQGGSDRMDALIELSPDGETLRHVNILYVGSIDSECSTCFDSVETREIPLGLFTKDKFKHRAFGPVYLNGPRVTRRGDMNIEVGIRNANRRVRCIVTHRPQFDGVVQRPQLVLERIVLVNETSAQEGRGQVVDLPWSHFKMPRWLGLWRGRNMVLDACSDVDVGRVSNSKSNSNELAWREEIWAPSHLRKCRCSGVAGDDTHADTHALLELDGGVRVEAPKVVLGGEPAEMSLRWATDQIATGEPSRIALAKVRFEALSKIVGNGVNGGDTNNVRISPPKLLRFDVADLEPVKSAGLT